MRDEASPLPSLIKFYQDRGYVGIGAGVDEKGKEKEERRRKENT